ncbi:hypothetical protein [Winogradskyella sp.]|jgi:hypothetical protein|uniref:hypothetical protein n=1 Tax=Winogradskyella sp. TaxID=1883156 RepID=UPI0025F5DB64|nr:hypothetical protein [Winogradskyella sp.]MCT4629598.1 hypothetical protein [Winogradskyella sp.]
MYIKFDFNDLPINYSGKDYLDNYKNYFEKFKKKYPKATIDDFLENELSRYLKYLNNVEELYEKKELINPKASRDYFFDPKPEDFTREIIDKISKNEEERTNIYLGLKETFTTINDLRKTQSTESSFLDLSESDIASKIIYLYELGILEFLQKEYKNYSVNALASIISGITGEKQTSIQSYLNPLLNKNDIDDPKSPYRKSGKVESIRSKIVTRGFSK